MPHHKDDPKKDWREDENTSAEENKDDQFSPGEAEDYNPEDFATD